MGSLTTEPRALVAGCHCMLGMNERELLVLAAASVAAGIEAFPAGNLDPSDEVAERAVAIALAIVRRVDAIPKPAPVAMPRPIAMPIPTECP